MIDYEDMEEDARMVEYLDRKERRSMYYEEDDREEERQEINRRYKE